MYNYIKKNDNINNNMDILNVNNWKEPSNDLLTEISFNLLFDHQIPNEEMCKVVSFLMILEQRSNVIIDWNFFRWSYNLNIDNLYQFNEITGNLFSSEVENKEKTLIKLKAYSLYRRYKFIPSKKDDIDEIINDLCELNI